MNPRAWPLIGRMLDALLPRDGSRAMNADLDMGTNAITDVVDPTNPQDADTLAARDAAVLAALADYVQKAGDTMTGDLIVDGAKIQEDDNTYMNMDRGDIALRAATGKITLTSVNENIHLLASNGNVQLDSPIAMGGHKINAVTDPALDTDADTMGARNAAIDTHKGEASVHHSRYTDAEVDAIVLAALLDYVQKAGDTMTGNLTILNGVDAAVHLGTNGDVLAILGTMGTGDDTTAGGNIFVSDGAGGVKAIMSEDDDVLAILGRMGTGDPTHVGGNIFINDGVGGHNFLVDGATGNIFIVGDIKLEGDKIIFDTDEDSYFIAASDDLLKLFVGAVEVANFYPDKTIFKKPLDMFNLRIESVANPTGPQHVVTKAYGDANYQSTISGWFDDGADFRITVTDGIITAIGDSVAGGHS